MNIKSRLEYKFAFFIDILVQIFSYTTIFINLWILTNKIDTVNGWSFHELLFLWDLNLFSYGVAGFFFYRACTNIEALVHSGEFDSLLTKPVRPLEFLVYKNISTIFLAHIILSICVFIYLADILPIQWDIYKICFMISVLIGASLIQMSIMLTTGSIAFWTTKSSSITNTLIYGLRNFIVYPLTIYNKFVQIILTFIIPYAFITFYPSSFLLNKDDVLFSSNLTFLTLIVGIISFKLSILIWKKGVRSYTSTGN